MVWNGMVGEPCTTGGGAVCSRCAVAAGAEKLVFGFRLSDSVGCLARCTSSTHRPPSPLPLLLATASVEPTQRKVWDHRLPGSSSAMVTAALNVQQARVQDDTDHGRSAGCERGVTAESVSRLCQQGQLVEAVEALGVLVQTHGCVSTSLFYALLKQCVVKEDLVLGRRVHALVVGAGFESDTFLCNHIIRMYASHAKLQDAMDVFAMVAEPDAFTWSAIISAHVKHGEDKLAIELYHRMRSSSVKPDGHVFVAALQACAKGGDLKSGQELHAHVLASGVQHNLFVWNCLVDMYGKCGRMEEARRVFDGLSEKDVVTWSALIAGYAQQGMGLEALGLYRAMEEQGAVAPNAVTFVCLVQACAVVGTLALETGKELHARIRGEGLEADALVAGSLVNMYAKCGSLEDAQRVFDGLEWKNVVTWTALIAGYSQQGMGEEALRLYNAMGEEGMAPPDAVTFVCLLQACASVSALHVGRQLHAQIVDQCLQADVTVCNSLINMYAKSGSMVDAQQVFDTLLRRDIVAWGALIAGYTRQGNSDQVFHLLGRMSKEGTQPDGITFLSVLTVCSHTGLVTKGQEYFETMSRHYGITPTVEHYICMVDLLGRAGQLDESLALVRAMPDLPNAAVWKTLLAACRKWNNVQVGRRAFDEAVKLDSKDPASYVLMLNIYISAQMWEQAQEMQSRRLEVGAWKQPGQSWWTDMDGLVHAFLVGDQKHPERESIYVRLDQLFSEMKKNESVPYLDSWPLHRRHNSKSAPHPIGTLYDTPKNANTRTMVIIRANRNWKRSVTNNL